MTANAGDEPPPRNAWQLMVSRDFGVFFGGRLATAIGTWLFTVTSMIGAFEATSSAFLVGVVSVVQFAPQIFLGPLSGRWTDRGSVKLQLILGRVLLSLGAFGLAGWYLWGPDGQRSEFVAILCASVFFGLGLVIGGPAMQSAGPELVRRSELPIAMALSTAPMTVGRIAGPAIGAVMAVEIGFSAAFAFSGLLSLLFIALMAVVSFPATAPRKAGAKYRMSEALAFLARDRPALLSLVGVAAVGVGAEPLMTLAPALILEAGGDTRAVGGLISAMGLGAAVAVLLSSVFGNRLRQERVALCGMVVMSASLAICVVPLPPKWIFIPFVLAGFGFIIAQAAFSTILQLRLPSFLRGRVMALWLIGFVGSRPIGALAVGAVADATSVYVAFGVGGATMLLAAVICRPSRLRYGDTDSGSLPK